MRGCDIPVEPIIADIVRFRLDVRNFTVDPMRTAKLANGWIRWKAMTRVGEERVQNLVESVGKTSSRANSPKLDVILYCLIKLIKRVSFHGCN